jgi:SHS2 domain-containing protein
MSASGHESVDHTADLAIRAWAPDLRGLIEQAAIGMLDLMLDDRPEPGRQRDIVGEGQSPEDLLIDCLREILALVNIERLIPVSVEVTEVDDDRARCSVGVVAMGDRPVAPAQEIKAVTYHDLEVLEVQGHLEVTVVFDV